LHEVIIDLNAFFAANRNLGYCIFSNAN